MHPAGEKRGGRPNDKYTAEALESIKQDLTRFEVQNNHRNNQVSELNEMIKISKVDKCIKIYVDNRIVSTQT